MKTVPSFGHVRGKFWIRIHQTLSSTAQNQTKTNQTKIANQLKVSTMEDQNGNLISSQQWASLCITGDNGSRSQKSWFILRIL